MKRLSAPRYDLFKTIVTVLLLLILLLMLLRGCATNTAAPAPTERAASLATRTIAASPSATQATLAPGVTQTLPSLPTPTATESPATPTTVEATNTPTAAATESATAAPEQTTPTAQVPNTSCNTKVPSRLSVGQKARVLQRLNMRKDASITAAILRTNLPGTQVEIIGGPVCTPVGGSAYLWWQIRLASGAEGWSAESALNDATYFLEPAS